MPPETEKIVREAVTEWGVGADIEKVKGAMETAGCGVFGTPAVVVDGKVKTRLGGWNPKRVNLC